MNLESIQESVIFECIAGSHAYGTATPESDTDIRGIFMLPDSHYLSLEPRVEQVSDSSNDTVFYTLRRVMELAAGGNPNILELLFMPWDSITKDSSIYRILRDQSELFISKRTLDCYAGYAHAQIKKARGQNKLVMNPKPVEKPVKEDFCWVIPFNHEHEQSDKYPFRPVPVKDTDIQLSEYHCSAVEHCHNTYRLYYYGNDAKGIFRGDDTLCCESIPIYDEHERFGGILIYNKDAFDRELKEWNQYWQWMKNRNPTRWVDQEKGTMDYDGKNLSHCFRLLKEGEHILEHGYPLVRFEGDELQKLKAIRTGKYDYDELIEDANKRIAQLDEKRKTCSLPKTVNLKRISELFQELQAIYAADQEV